MRTLGRTSLRISDVNKGGNDALTAAIAAEVHRGVRRGGGAVWGHVKGDEHEGHRTGRR